MTPQYCVSLLGAPVGLLCSHTVLVGGATEVGVTVKLLLVTGVMAGSMMTMVGGVAAAVVVGMVEEGVTLLLLLLVTEGGVTTRDVRVEDCVEVTVVAIASCGCDEVDEPAVEEEVSSGQGSVVAVLFLETRTTAMLLPGPTGSGIVVDVAAAFGVCGGVDATVVVEFHLPVSSGGDESLLMVPGALGAGVDCEAVVVDKADVDVDVSSGHGSVDSATASAVMYTVTSTVVVETTTLAVGHPAGSVVISA